MFELALAQSAAPAAAPSGNPIIQFLPMILIFVVFYFLLIRPNIKKQKAHVAMLKSLKIGDQVVTSSGIIGTIKNMTDAIVTVEIADSVRVKFLRSQIGQVASGNLEEMTQTR